MRRIASLAGGVAAQLASGGDATAALPCEQMRCGGPTTVIGVREGVLWLVDSRARPFVIPMAHAGLRARYLAAHGDFPAARAVAEKGTGLHALPLRLMPLVFRFSGQQVLSELILLNIGPE